MVNVIKGRSGKKKKEVILKKVQDGLLTYHEVSNDEGKERNGCSEGLVLFKCPGSRHDDTDGATADSSEEAN